VPELIAITPYHAWCPWKFTKTPPLFWEELGRHLSEDIVRQVCFSEYYCHLRPDDYDNTSIDLLRPGSIEKMVQQLPPRHTLFRYTANKSTFDKIGQVAPSMARVEKDWTNQANGRQFLLDIKHKLGSFEALYHISTADITRLGGTTPNRHYRLPADLADHNRKGACPPLLQSNSEDDHGLTKEGFRLEALEV